MAHVGQVNRYLYDFTQVRICRRQHTLDVSERLRQLRIKVTDANQCALLINPA
jgi:hypothetical protein